MAGQYVRIAFEVHAEKYEPWQNIEDGLALWTQVVTQGGVATERLLKITQPDGIIVCPYVKNRRGIVYLQEGDYVITESDGEKHACGVDRFFERYTPVEGS